MCGPVASARDCYGISAATSAPGLGSPLPHLHRDWAHPGHICTGTGLTPATSAPGLGSPRPHLHRDWARPCHICTGTGLTPATSAPGLGPPLPHLHRDWAHPCHICAGGLTLTPPQLLHDRTHSQRARPQAQASTRTRRDRVAPDEPAAVLVGMHGCAAATVARCVLCVRGVLHRRCTTSPTCWWTSRKATPRRRTIDGEGDATETNAARDIPCRAGYTVPRGLRCHAARRLPHITYGAAHLHSETAEGPFSWRTRNPARLGSPPGTIQPMLNSARLCSGDDGGAAKLEPVWRLLPSIAVAVRYAPMRHPIASAPRLTAPGRRRSSATPPAAAHQCEPTTGSHPHRRVRCRDWARPMPQLHHACP